MLIRENINASYSLNAAHPFHELIDIIIVIKGRYNCNDKVEEFTLSIEEVHIIIYHKIPQQKRVAETVV
jgi:hypothetical protein